MLHSTLQENEENFQSHKVVQRSTSMHTSASIENALGKLASMPRAPMQNMLSFTVGIGGYMYGLQSKFKNKARLRHANDKVNKKSAYVHVTYTPVFLIYISNNSIFVNAS